MLRVDDDDRGTAAVERLGFVTAAILPSRTVMSRCAGCSISESKKHVAIALRSAGVSQLSGGSDVKSTVMNWPSGSGVSVGVAVGARLDDRIGAVPDGFEAAATAGSRAVVAVLEACAACSEVPPWQPEEIAMAAPTEARAPATIAVSVLLPMPDMVVGVASVPAVADVAPAVAAATAARIAAVSAAPGRPRWSVPSTIRSTSVRNNARPRDRRCITASSVIPSAAPTSFAERSDRDQMAAMDVHALPSAIVNGKRVHGALPAASYLSAVEDALAPAR